MIMMGGDKKKALNAILGQDPNSGEGESPPDYLKECVSEFIEAVHSKDVEGAASALRACFSELGQENGGE